MSVSEQEYRRIALADREGKWELDCGLLRSKPPMTTWHNRTAWFLGVELQNQLGRTRYEVRVDAGRTRRSPSHYYIPDVIVIPIDAVRRGLSDTFALEAYAEPLPLVVEVWSPSTGDYDIDKKLPEYRRRGDLEVWRIHPYEHTLTAWVRQADGTYLETVYRGGVVHPSALPGISIDLDALFAEPEEGSQ
ncbi:MAG: Uma2 family endonuclease [Dehalococcoidia bacterium]